MGVLHSVVQTYTVVPTLQYAYITSHLKLYARHVSFRMALITLFNCGTGLQMSNLNVD